MGLGGLGGSGCFRGFRGLGVWGLGECNIET